MKRADIDKPFSGRDPIGDQTRPPRPRSRLVASLAVVAGALIAAALIAAGCGGRGPVGGPVPTIASPAPSTSATTSTTTSTPAPVTTTTAVPTTAVTTTTSTTASATVDSDSCAPPGSSPADFDPASGQYATYLSGVDVAARTVSFDVVQFLVGADAVAAYHKANPTATGGPPNDYFVVNAVTRIDTAKVAPDPRVRLLDRQNLRLTGATFPQLTDALQAGGKLFWLTFSNSVITDICQQYTP